MAIVYFIDHSKYYISNKKFTLRTDHSSLRWLNSFKSPQGILARWLERLSGYEYEVIHRAGTLHLNADAMSRISSNDNDLVNVVMDNLIITPETLFSTGEFAKLQDLDQDIIFMKADVARGGLSDFEMLPKPVSLTMLELRANFNSLKVENNIFIQCNFKNLSSPKYVIVLPVVARECALKLHDSKVSCHLGVDKLRDLIKSRYVCGVDGRHPQTSC